MFMNRRDFERLRKLRELQKLGMAVAEDLHARAKGEKDPKKLIELADSLILVGEEIREAMVLEAKLAREMDAAAPVDPLVERARIRARVRARRRLAPDPRLAADPPTSTRY